MGDVQGERIRVDRDPGSFRGAFSRPRNRHRRRQRGPKSANAHGRLRGGCSGARPPVARSAPVPDHECRRACRPAVRAPLQNQAPPLTPPQHGRPRHAANSGRRKRPARTPLSPQVWRPTFHCGRSDYSHDTPPLICASSGANYAQRRVPQAFRFRRDLPQRLECASGCC